jgi:hypothetical protein
MRKILLAHKQIIGVGFQKADGSKRFMALRRNTLFGVKGDEAAPSSQAARRTRKKNHPHLVSVLELKKGLPQWRTLNLKTLFTLRVNGEKFQVV